MPPRTDAAAHDAPPAEAALFALLDPAPVGLAAADLDGRIRRVNGFFCRMLDEAPEALVGRPFQDITHSDDRAENDRELARLLSGESAGFRLEKRYLRRDESAVWADVTVALVRDGAGAPSHLLAVVQDTSARRAAGDALERREREFHGVLAAVPDIIVRFGPDLRHRYVNPAISRVTGIDAEQFIGRTNRELGFPEDMCARWDRMLGECLTRGETCEADWAWTTPSGEVIPFHSRLIPERDAAGAVASILAVTRDVREAQRLERALTAEGRYQALVEATSAAVWRAGADGLFHGPQPSWEALTGQTTGEVQGVGWLAAVHPEDRRTTLAAWTRAVAERSVYEVEHRVRTRAGEWRPMHARAAPVPGPAGAPLEWVGMEADISARRQAERTVRFQASLLEAVDEAVVATDLSGRVTYWNAPAARLLGWGADEVAGRDLRGVLAGAAWPGDAMELLLRLQGGEGWSGEVELERRDGSRFHARVSAAAVRNEAGALTGVVRVLADVSGMKTAEAVARESEARFRALALTSPDVICVVDAETGAVTFANRETLLGWPMHGPGAAERIRDAVHPDDRARVNAAWEAALRGEGGAGVEHRVRRPDGGWGWIETRHALLSSGEGGAPREILCTIRTTTERREAEEALRRSEEHLRRVLDHVGCAVGVLDADGTLTYANHVSLRATGARAEDAIGRPFERTAPWAADAEAAARVRAALDRAAAGEAVRRDERARLADGRATTVDLVIAPMRDDAGRVTHLIASAVDIDARVRAQAELAAQQDRLRLTLRATGAVMWEWDAAADVVTWDASLAERFGWQGVARTDLAWWSDRIHPDDRPAVERAVAEARARRTDELALTYRFRHADGRWIPVRDRGCAEGADGDVRRMVGVMVDLSTVPGGFALPPLVPGEPVASG